MSGFDAQRQLVRCMSVMSPDSELVSAYATERSEPAFRALVSRHVGLVYGTALRQVGDHGLAEEITQNVFVTLARKSPRLGGVETLAGWLHRTATFESKARIRSELRRRRREDTAATLATLEANGDSPFEPLIPLLDEALLHLREGDRLALVLRYLEERSLRDVGAALGVDEDAARKRVSRALQRLIEFFRGRGFTVPAAAGLAVVLSNTATAVPVGVASSATKAGLTAGGAVTGFQLFLFHLMALTKTQTVVICALMAVAPILWQERVQARTEEQQREADLQIAAANTKASQLERDRERLRQRTAQIQIDAADAQARLASMTAQRAGKVVPPAYIWDDSSPVARIPKAYLMGMSGQGVMNQRGGLSPLLTEVLQFKETEKQAVQAAIDRFLASYQSELAAHVHLVPSTEEERKNGEVRAFEVKASAVSSVVKQLRSTFFAEVKATIGGQRFDVFRESLRYWMPIDDKSPGVSSGLAIYTFDHRQIFTKPKPGDSVMSWQVKNLNNGSMSTSIQFEELPDFLQGQFQDWKALAESEPFNSQAQP
ncbi:MAG: hypothetical protein JWM68_5849 [Verrucomicrobiales bacterium]|nr:hypothetical protein [Verrucomicrobiales bacterium]